MKEYIFLGILLGIISGFIPAIHSNTIISFLNEFGVSFEIFPYLIISIFGAFTICSFVPSIFFGIPDDSSVLTVLPGQKLVKEGNGPLALKTVIFCSIFTSVICLAMFPVSLVIFPIIYSSISSYMPEILIILSLILLIKSKKPFFAFLIFLLSGMLGVATFNLNLKDPFLPIFCGMFALAAMYAYKKSKIPPQKDEKLDLGILKYIFAGIAGGFFADLIPGVSSPSQVSTFISIFIPITSLGYLAAISSISVSQSIFAIATDASINKSRVGAIVWLSQFTNLSEEFYLYALLFIFSLSTAGLFLYFFRMKISSVSNVDFSKLNIVFALYLFLLIFLIDGIIGIIIFLGASFLGYCTIKLDVERTFLMGAIIIPTILFFLKIFI